MLPESSTLRGRGGATVVLVAACLLVIVTALCDWSPIATQDPARSLGLGPNGVVALGTQHDRTPLSAIEYSLFVAVGIAYIACGLIAANGHAPGLTAFLLCAAGVVWIVGGLRLSSQPWAFTIGAVSTIWYGPILIQLVMAFPSGRLTERWPRRLCIASYGFFVVASVLSWMVFDPRQHVLYGQSTSVNLILIGDRYPLEVAFGWVFSTVYIAIVLTAVAILAARWRRGSYAYRRACLPLWWALILLAAALVWVTLGASDFLRPWTHTYWTYLLRFWVPALIPLAVLIGLTRYRIARGAVSRMMADIGAGEVSIKSLEVSVRHTLRDPTAAIWTWSMSTNQYVDSSVRPCALSQVAPPRMLTLLERGGEPLGALIHDHALVQQPELLEAVRTGTTLLLDNLRLTASLAAQLATTQESRQRIVAASDAERRRLERDIHDGAQQQLVAAALILRRAGRTTTAEPARAMIAEGCDQLERAIADLRELARGVHPPVLRDRGISPALVSLAERTALPITIEDSFHRRTVDAVEACVYFTASEAITNVVRHAGATHIDLELHEDGSVLMLRVVDDGCGGAHTQAAGGLIGLQDRVAALGGSLQIDSPLGVGTTLTMTIPTPGDQLVAT